MVEYQRTQFGGWPWSEDAVIFPRNKPRFALKNGVEEFPPTKKPAVVYKIVDNDVWAQASAAGEFGGASIDLKDGFIHLSTLEQAPGTLARFFKGVSNLSLVGLDATKFGDKVRCVGCCVRCLILACVCSLSMRMAAFRICTASSRPIPPTVTSSRSSRSPLTPMASTCFERRIESQKSKHNVVLGRH